MLVPSILLGALAATAAAKSAVLDIIPSNVDEMVLKSGKPTLVEFFAPWCGHCKNLAPVYEELALAFESQKDKVQVAKVDCDANKPLCKRFGVQGYPTLKWFDGKNDKPEDYKSGRDLDSLSNFISDKTGVKTKKKPAAPSAVKMLTDSTFAKAIGGEKNVLVAFTAPWCGHCKSLAPVWEKVAHAYANEKNVLIAKVDADAATGKATAKKYEVTGYPTIKFFPAGSKEAETYKGGRSEVAFVDFLNDKAGTHRLPGGKLSSLAGTVESLDKVLAKAATVPLKDLATDMQAQVKLLKDTAELKYAEYYDRVVQKLIKSEDYVGKELPRLKGIIKKGGLTATKRDELQIKINVLEVYFKELAKKSGEAKDEGEKAEDVDKDEL